MKLRNQYGVETRNGFRTFRLYEGDICGLNEHVDVLAVSAFHGSYHPTPGTIIGGLRDRLGVDVSALARNCEYDLRLPLGIWISKPIPGQFFSRLLCVELVGAPHSPSQALENVFVGIAVLEAKGLKIVRVALPVLGAGRQGLQPIDVIESLLPAAKRALEQSSCLEQIIFVEVDPTRVEALSDGLDEILGRSKVHLPRGPLMESLRADILTTLSRCHELIPSGHNGLLDELRHLLRQDEPRSFEVGILGRRLVEFIVDDLLGRKKTSPDLIQKIDRLAELGVAPWIRGYMHTLRILGNDEAHEKNREGRKPQFADEDDVAISLFAMHRVLNFWQQYRRGAATGTAGAAASASAASGGALPG